MATPERIRWIRIPASALEKVRGIAHGLAEMGDGEHGAQLDALDVGVDASNILHALRNVKPDHSTDLVAALRRIRNVAESIRLRITDPDLVDMAGNIEADARAAIARGRR